MIEIEKLSRRYIMSVRQNVFNHLTENPEASLDQVLAEFASEKNTTVRRYFFEFQKLDSKESPPAPKKGSKAKKTGTTATKKSSQTAKKAKAGKQTKAPNRKKTAKQRVAEYMSKNPDAALEEVCSAIPEARRNTIANYRIQWKKENDSSSEKQTKDKIFDFLNNNPTSNLNDLKEVFPEVGNKLITIFRSWKNLQERVSEQKGTVEDSVTADERIGKNEREDDQEKQAKPKQNPIIEHQKDRFGGLKKQVARVKRPGIVDAVKNFIIDKLSRR